MKNAEKHAVKTMPDLNIRDHLHLLLGRQILYH